VRIVVTGRNGQVARSLVERAPAFKVEVLTVARPDIDLTRPSDVEDALVELRPDAIVNAAAYTAVDQSESSPDLAHLINVLGAAAAGRAAAKVGAPIIQHSPDYVFNDRLDRAYREDDSAHPLGVYGDSKLQGERAVATANRNHVILRLAWLYSPFGTNFVRKILALACGQSTIPVVSDQWGTPTNALDVADGVIAVVKNLLERPSAAELRGIFHMAGGGEANWAEFTAAILAASAAAGGPSARVVPISTSDYPTLARRPANSRLDSSRLADLHGVRLPAWRLSLQGCIGRLLPFR
jgi:dTDP-4-dehydrorhamnose reductase